MSSGSAPPGPPGAPAAQSAPSLMLWRVSDLRAAGRGRCPRLVRLRAHLAGEVKALSKPTYVFYVLRIFRDPKLPFAQPTAVCATKSRIFGNPKPVHLRIDRNRRIAQSQRAKLQPSEQCVPDG